MWKSRLEYLEFSDSIHRVRFHLAVVRIFRKYEQKESKLEAGGILLGYVYENYDEIVNATAPSKLDSRYPLSFNRSKIPAQLKINRSWKRSKGHLIYLGEWHTHCETDPSPSTVDYDMIRKVFEETKIKTDFLYLIIVGLNNTYWVGRQTAEELIKFHRIK